MNGADPARPSLEPFKDPLKMPRRLKAYGGHEHHHLTIRMLAATTQLHSDLPPTRVWGTTVSIRAR